MEQARAVLVAGGEVWVGDESTPREFPPLRAAWSRHGQQAAVVISGHNARRVIVGALNVTTGALLRVVRERSRGEDIAAGLAAFVRAETERPRLLIWDNAPPHQAKRAQQAAVEQGIELSKPPYRSPKLNPLEDLWRSLKRVVAANRAYATVEEPAERPLAYLDSVSADDRLRLASLHSSKFDWLPT